MNINTLSQRALGSLMAVSGQGFGFTFQSLVGVILKQNLRIRSYPLRSQCVHECACMYARVRVCARPWALHIWGEIKALLSAHVAHFWLASSPLNVLGLIQEKWVLKNHTSEGKKKHPSFYILGWHFSLNMNDLIIISLSERWAMKVQKSSDRERLWTCLSHVLGVYIMLMRGKRKASNLHPRQETEVARGFRAVFCGEGFLWC